MDGKGEGEGGREGERGREDGEGEGGRKREGGREEGRKGDQKQTIGVMEQHILRMRSLTSAFHTCAGTPHVQKLLWVCPCGFCFLSFYLSVGDLSINDRTVFYFSAAS